MKHIGERLVGDILTVKSPPVTPRTPPETWENRAKYEIIGIGPNFYGTIADDILEFEEGFLSAPVTIGEWSEGTYLIRASWLDSEGWMTEESLLTVKHPVTDETREGPETALAPFLEEAKVIGHIPYEDESIPFTYEVENGELIIRPIEPLEPNHTYTVYVGPKTVLVGGDGLDIWVKTVFDTKVTPLYVTRSEVLRELGKLADVVSERTLLTTIRQAGLKAHQLQRLNANVYDSSSFEMVEDDADNYYATTRFVLYETLIQTANGIYAEMVFGDDTLGYQSGSYMIGDLQVQGSRDDGAGKIKQAGDILNKRLSSWERDVVYWRDAMLNRNARGYARSQNAAYRSGAGSPNDRTL